MSPSSMTLFDPVVFGSSTLKHRIVLDLVFHNWNDARIIEYFDRVEPEGGLVLVPNAVTEAASSTQKYIIDRLHLHQSIVFAQVSVKTTAKDDGFHNLVCFTKKAINMGYDGVEINMEPGLLQGDSSSASEMSAMIDSIHAVAKIMPCQQIGVRLSMFDVVNSHRPDSYCPLIESIQTWFPSLGFIHFVTHKRFHDFEYASNKSLDELRAVVRCSDETNPDRQDRIPLIWENACNPSNVSQVAPQDNEFVAMGLPADANPALVSLLRRGDSDWLAADIKERLHLIRSVFEIGKEYVIEWNSELQEAHVEQAMNNIGTYLSNLDPALSYEGTDKKVSWRKSCWFASDGIGLPFCDTHEAIVTFDGDLKDGLTGLRALQNPDVRKSMQYLKDVLDSALVTTSHAVGIDANMLQRCTVRYRVIKYTPHQGMPGGIGLHPDGNLLSALITNNSGLRVYDLDGTLRSPGHRGTIMMGGSTLYRWSGGKYIPTFHDVDVNGDGTKTSIVAFFNFPDMVKIAPSRVLESPEHEGFFHDIKRIKEDDKLPSGELSRLWDTIIEKHALKL